MTQPRSSIGRCFLFTAGLAITMLLHACGGDGPPDHDEIASMSEDEAADMAREMKDLSGVEACELLTTSEIQAATGIAPGEPQDMSQVQGQLPMCTWPAADGSGRNVASILVTRGGMKDYDQFLEMTRTGMGADFDESSLQHVSDVGDFGVWMGEGSWGMLQVYDADMMVQVDAEVAQGKDELEASKDLALRVFGRL